MIEKLISTVAEYRRQMEFEDSGDTIDWSVIVEMLRMKNLINHQYSEKCLEHLWREVCLPTIQSNDTWSEDEDRLLHDLIDIHGPFADQWSLIASHFVGSIFRSFSHSFDLFLSLLATSFSVLVCQSIHVHGESSSRSNVREERIRWQDSFFLFCRKFDVDRLNELKDLVEECRCDHYVPLNKSNVRAAHVRRSFGVCLVVAYRVGCSLSSIRREWRNVDPEVRRGHWTNDEDQSLLRSVVKQSTRETINWHLVSREVSGRSSTKCFHRYIHLTRKTNVKRDFQDSEDQLLIEQHRIKQGQRE